MSDFSLRLPRIFRSHSSRRSHSPKPSSTDSRDDAAASHAPCPSPSPAVSSRPSSAHGDPKQVENAAMDHPRVGRASGGPSGRPIQDSRLTTPLNAVDMNSTLRPQGSINPRPISLPYVPNSAGARPPEDLSHRLATPLQHTPSDPESQKMSLSQKFHRLMTPLKRSKTPASTDIPAAQHKHPGMFHQAHNFSATGNSIDGNVGNVSVTLTNSINNCNSFMEKLLKETIPGAAADSSARDPPPRCHPGTRLAILDRCLNFIAHSNGMQKMRWVVGAAGVGKSAVMQNIAESPQLEVASNTSIFFSINGRNDGTKAIMTLSYQLAAGSDLYRRVIEEQVNRDPRLLQSSMATQFDKFIIQPFIRNHVLNSAGRVLIIIDGLDECDSTRTQVELLRIISAFCISHPSSPIVWLIASRPEPHITSFFARPEIVSIYEKEEITVDSDEARADVERYLRHELTEIRNASDFVGPQWPDEQHLWKLANAAGGLFAYAHTAYRYIGDSSVGDPISQLSDVLNAIDDVPMPDVPREQHPMAQLDALYARILSNVPPKSMANARELLLLLASDWDRVVPFSFVTMCNWLGMTADTAYAALNRLRSVLHSPQRHEAHKRALKPFHKSFIDYILRSGLFIDIGLEARQVMTRCAFRVLNEVPSGIRFNDVDSKFYYGELARSDVTDNRITITWRVNEKNNRRDTIIQSNMYKLAMGEVVAGMKRGDPQFQSDFCIKLLTTHFQYYWQRFPCRELSDFVFDKTRRQKFMQAGTLKQIPAKAIPISTINTYLDCRLQFHRPGGTAALPDPWYPSCRHERVGQLEPGKEQDWTTVFDENCTPCFHRLKHQFKNWISLHPDDFVSILFASAEDSCVEFRFVDLEGDSSEWIYWVWLWNSPRIKELANII